jgi:hypothetical protein
MKLVVTMVMSTLYMTVKPSKPFNPILGETYEGFMCLNNKEKEKEIESVRNGSTVSPAAQIEVFKAYLEQTCHHPPISNFLFEGNMVRIYGNFECVGKNSKNSYNIKNSGPCTVDFLDTKQKIRFQLPDTVMSGILFGTMQLYLHNSMIFHDKENELKAHVTFDSDHTDKLKGSIYKFNKAKL